MLQPQVLDVLPEALEGVLVQPLHLVVVQVEGGQLVDAAKGLARERLDDVAGQRQALKVFWRE